MRQRARVISASADGARATVRVSRSSMCEGCERTDGCGKGCGLSGIVASDASKTATAEAVNDVGAKPGMLVEVESAPSRILGFAALVFVLPLLVCAGGYAAGARLFGSERAGILAALTGFVLTFVLIALADRLFLSKKPSVHIVAILSAGRRDRGEETPPPAEQAEPDTPGNPGESDETGESDATEASG